MPNGQQRIPPTPANGSASDQVHSAKKQTKWTPAEDARIIHLRSTGMKWEDISRELPGRSAISCRLHYQNYLEKRQEWNEDKKNKLARLYERFKQEMWAKVADEMEVPWRAAEAMHWNLGPADMARRAGVPQFELITRSEGGEGSSHRSPQRSHPAPPPPGPYPREMMPAGPMHGRSQSLSTMTAGQAGTGRDPYQVQSQQALAPGARLPHAHQGHPSMHAPTPTAVVAAAAAMAVKGPQKASYPPPTPRGADYAKPEHRGDYVKTEHYEQSAQPTTGPGLAPIQSAPRPGGRDMLPSIRELTTGMQSYPHGPPPSAAGQGHPRYPNQVLGSVGHKRRASVDTELREVQRRRLM